MIEECAGPSVGAVRQLYEPSLRRVRLPCGARARARARLVPSWTFVRKFLGEGMM